MKKLFSLFALFVGFAAAASAQRMNLEPGIYVVADNQYIPIRYQNNTGSSFGLGDMNLSKGRYRGAAAEVCSTGQFLLVCDPDRRVVVESPWSVRPFVSWFTPKDLGIVKLTPKKRCRTILTSLESGNVGLDLSWFQSVDFTWERCADNAFLIQCNAEPGEYAFVYRPGDDVNYNFDHIWGFSSL